MIACVVPTYGQFALAEQAARSFMASTPDAMVVVVDDGSSDWPGHESVQAWTDGTSPVATIRYDRHERNLSRSWNAGIRYALRMPSVDVVVPSNSDVLFPPGWWAGVADALNSGWDICGPVTNQPGHCSGQQVARYIDGDGLDAGNPDLAGLVQASLPIHEPIGRSMLNGYTMAARRNVWEKLDLGGGNYYSPSCPFLGNEDELMARARNAGLRSCIVPTSFVWHAKKATRNAEG